MILLPPRRTLEVGHAATRLTCRVVLPPRVPPPGWGCEPGNVPTVVLSGHDLPERDRAPWAEGLAAVGLATVWWTAEDVEAGAAPSERAARLAAVLGRLERGDAGLPPGTLDVIALVGHGLDAAGVLAQARQRPSVAAVLLFSPVLAGLADPGPPLAPSPAPSPAPRPGPLAGLDRPCLVLFGERDAAARVAETTAALRAGRGGARERCDVAVVRDADQALRVPAAHGIGGLSGSRYRFGDWPLESTEFLARWLAEHAARGRAAGDVDGERPGGVGQVGDVGDAAGEVEAAGTVPAPRREAAG